MATLLVLAVLAILPSCRDEHAAEPRAAPSPWTTLVDVAHLDREVAAATKAGRPIVVDVAATWCKYCKLYETLLEGDPAIGRLIAPFVRLRVDVTNDPRVDLREALGMGQGQPRMVFYDRKGRIVRKADVDRWYGPFSAEEVRDRIALVLAEGGAGNG